VTANAQPRAAMAVGQAGIEAGAADCLNGPFDAAQVLASAMSWPPGTFRREQSDRVLQLLQESGIRSALDLVTNAQRAQLRCGGDVLDFVIGAVRHKGGKRVSWTLHPSAFSRGFSVVAAEPLRVLSEQLPTEVFSLYAWTTWTWSDACELVPVVFAVDRRNPAQAAFALGECASWHPVLAPDLAVRQIVGATGVHSSAETMAAKTLLATFGAKPDPVTGKFDTHHEPFIRALRAANELQAVALEQFFWSIVPD
jgi:hypothetical protein